MVHCNNCTNDMNEWVSLLRETLRLMGCEAEPGELFTKLYQHSLAADADGGGITVYNYLAGEPVTGFDEGRPLVVRRPGVPLTLANFIRAQLYSTMATLAVGMDILAKENVTIDRMMGHGGLFKTPVVGQRYMAAACKAPVTCMETAGEGGPYGMALLAAYARCGEGSLEEFLQRRVFADCAAVTLEPEAEDLRGFEAYLTRFIAGLPAEKAAVENL